MGRDAAHRRWVYRRGTSLGRPTTLKYLQRTKDALLRVRAFSMLRYREYRLLWFGQAFGTMGTLMDEVTRGWLIYELYIEIRHGGCGVRVG